MQHIELSPEKWQKLLKELHQDYPKSVLAIKEKCKMTLGFTSREYNKWTPNKEYRQEMLEFERLTKEEPDMWFMPPAKGDYEKIICLDFFDDLKKTFFVLKYSEFL
jgi:hypothetical protein